MIDTVTPDALADATARGAASTLPGADPETWFPEDWQDPEPAKAGCRACPLLTACRSWALAHPAEAEYGVWGATTPAERTAHRLDGAALEGRAA